MRDDSVSKEALATLGNESIVVYLISGLRLEGVLLKWDDVVFSLSSEGRGVQYIERRNIATFSHAQSDIKQRSNY